MSKKAKVMFVGGYGRSGSTIIDVLLNRVSGIVSVGEFRHLFGRALGNNELCSCSRPFKECPFWEKVINKAFPDGFDREKILAAMKDLNTVLKYPTLNYSAFMTSETKRSFDIYEEAFSEAYKAVLEVSDAKVVIDSSKYPMHGLFVNKMKDVDLKTMLLVRDPRAVAYSWQRKRVRPEVHWETRYISIHNVFRSGLAWNLSNSLTWKLDSGKESFRFQKYEDFTENPLKIIEGIATFALGKTVSLNQDIFNQQNKELHTIAGNPVRFDKPEIVISHDEAWQENMSSWKKAAVKAVCFRQMKRYKYN